MRSADLRAGSVGSSEVVDGSIQDGDLAASALGARAYGVLLWPSCSGSPAFCSIAHNKGIAYIVRVGTGIYCVGVNGISAETRRPSSPAATP